MSKSFKKSRYEINQPFISSNCKGRNRRAVGADLSGDVSNTDANQANEFGGVVAHVVAIFNCIAALHGTGVALVGRRCGADRKGGE
jgi:hypothetical protein